MIIDNENSVNTEEVATSVNDISAESSLDELLVIDDIDDNEVIEENENEVDADNQNEEVQDKVDFDSKKQSLNKDDEANTRFAKMRRENEELKRKNEIASKYLSTLYKDQGINDLESFNNYMQTYEENQKKQEYMDKGIDVDAIDKVIAERLQANPDLLKLKQMQEESKIQLEVQEFENSFPEYKDVKQIQELPNYEKVLEFRNKHHLSLTDAFTLANKDKLKEIRDKEVLKMKNNIKTDLVAKQNRSLSASSGTGAGKPIVITKADLNEWKKFYPSESEEQLKKRILKAKKRN